MAAGTAISGAAVRNPLYVTPGLAAKFSIPPGITGCIIWGFVDLIGAITAHAADIEHTAASTPGLMLCTTSTRIAQRRVSAGRPARSVALVCQGGPLRTAALSP